MSERHRPTGRIDPTPTSPPLPLQAPEEPSDEGLRRRLTHLMLFRVVLISIVLGTTTVFTWMSTSELWQAPSIVLYAIIGFIYLLTLGYAFALRRTRLDTLASWQLTGDLAIASVLVHVTGGAESAYTFFFPFAIIGAAVVRFRRGAINMTVAAAILFTALALLGWLHLLPSPPGQRILPSDMSAIEFSRAVALNLAAILGVGVLAVNLAGQLQRTSASLETQRSAAADLLVLHEDIVRSLTSGLITVSGEGKVFTINDAGCEILGVTPLKAVGHPLENIAPGLAALLRGLEPDQEIRRGQALFEPPGVRPLTLGVSLSPLYNHRDEVVGRIVNFQDLTEMKEMEEHVKRAERLAVVGGLAAGVAHEIRNPLASISGSVELLSSQPEDGEDNRALMNIVTREIDRLNGLITDLLDYTNPRPLRKTSVELRELVADTLRVFRQDARFAEVEVIVDEASDEAAHAAADPEKLRQALWNLLRNAAEAASHAGQHVWIRVSEAPTHVELEVSDDGEGIPVEALEKVFDPFFTTKVKGNGLGLATVHSIVTDHGGTIEVASVGRGSQFLVRLPRATESV